MPLIGIIILLGITLSWFVSWCNTISLLLSEMKGHWSQLNSWSTLYCTVVNFGRAQGGQLNTYIMQLFALDSGQIWLKHVRKYKWAIFWPIMGHLWPILGHFEHFGPNLAIWLHLEDRTHAVGLKWHNQSMVVLYRMPYNIYWPSVVIQGGHWAHFGPKMAVFHHILTIYWSYLDSVATVTTSEHGSLV